MAQVQELRLPANGFEFSGFSAGPSTGRTVLLLHGFPQTSASWTAVASRLAAGGLRAVAIDQRGYSPGARPPGVADYALPGLLADVLAVIDELGGTVDLVGHDWGGVVGWQLAARHPERLRTLTVASTPNQLAINAVHAAVPEERERFAYIRTFREPGRAERALLDDDARGLRALFGSSVAPERVETDVRALQQPGAMTAALNWYRAMAREDADGLGLVTVPTTYVWGSDDIAFSRAVAEASGAYVDADYTFVPLEGVSHWIPDEAPGVLADEILARVLAHQPQ
jgi:pimeloyl-ACP methyl ester carboxylesterase